MPSTAKLESPTKSQPNIVAMFSRVWGIENFIVYFIGLPNIKNPNVL
jgi:hypothetical protein